MATHLASPAAREGCLCYLDTLAVLDADTRAELRARLLIASPHTVAAHLWAGYYAALDATDPATRQALEDEDGPVVEALHSLDRLAEEPHWFHQFHPLLAA